MSTTSESQIPSGTHGGGVSLLVDSPPVTHPRTRPARPSKRKLFSPLKISFAALAALALGIGLYTFRNNSTTDEFKVLTFPVQPVSFDVQVKLAGELKAIRNVEIKNQVEGMSTILFLVPEGKLVKEGEELVRLASDTIKDRVEDARIRVENAKAALVNAQESLTIQEKQNESDLTTADTNANLAQLEFDQFDKGDAEIELETRKTAAENGKTDLARKTEDLARVKELAVKGFVTNNDVLDAEIAYRDSVNKLAKAEMDLKVWVKYAEPKQRQTVERKRTESLREMERVKIKCNAAILLKQADVRAKESTLRVESSRLTGLETQLENTVIKAPQSGMVVYQSSVTAGSWNSQGPIEEGVQVRQNQTLIQLPDTSKMMVEVKIAEQLTDRVVPGLPTVITVDAQPGKALTGKVEKINPLPDNSNRWMNSTLKEYPTQILLDTTPTGLKPGMSARAEIQIARLTDVLAVPLQAVFVGGGESYVFVGTPEKWEKVIVKPGASNPDLMEIKEGLKQGQTVLLSRPKGAPEDQPATTSRPGKKRKTDTTDKPAGAA